MCPYTKYSPYTIKPLKLHPSTCLFLGVVHTPFFPIQANLSMGFHSLPFFNIKQLLNKVLQIHQSKASHWPSQIYPVNLVICIQSELFLEIYTLKLYHLSYYLEGYFHPVVWHFTRPNNFVSSFNIHLVHGKRPGKLNLRYGCSVLLTSVVY